MRIVPLAALMLALAGSAAGCNRSPEPVPRVEATGVGGPIALVQTAGGLAGLRVGTDEPLWILPGAVAAPDGSAVFGLRRSGKDAHEVVRVDPWTGERTLVGTVEAAADLRVAAVEPGGRRLALIAPEGPSTRVVDYLTETGTVRGTRTFEGTVEPEAYSSDGVRLFAARIYGDRYHVHVLELTTGDQYPTFGPDKTRSPEDMYGSAVQAALSPDGRQLATLYRDDSTPDHTAFVHLLSLDNGLTICIDLHAPFGTSTTDADVIEWRGTTIAVGHHGSRGHAATLATFDTHDDPRGHYHADILENPDVPPPVLPGGVADIPGFRRFVAMAS